MRLQEPAAVALGALLAIALFAWVRTDETAGVAPPGGTPATAARGVGELPRIDLARLEAERTPPAAGTRDVFDFGGPAPAPRAEEAAGELPAPVATPPPLAEPTPTPVPALSVRFIGAVEKQGAKVAVLMTDKKEILTGQAGEVVANRLRIVRIGLESVDVQDVNGGAPRRLPLRAN
ncbi:MAG TPA: hypothetical protein VFM88_21255 [Vicinamibacteria bacterium]|nr:hypothetical protein [Vicinamibacteria bacterium]